MWRSLSNRIFLVALAVMAIGPLVFGLVGYRYLVRVEERGLGMRLTQELAWLEAALRIEDNTFRMQLPPEILDASGPWSVIVEPSGETLWSAGISRPSFLYRERVAAFGNPDLPPCAGSEIRVIYPADTREWWKRVYAWDVDRHSLLLRFRCEIDPGPNQRFLAYLRRIMAILLPLWTLATGGTLWWFVRRQLRPLERLAMEAAAIGGPAESERQRIGPVGDCVEYTRLRTALNEMLDRLDEVLRREHRFAMSVAHELRTPLAQCRATMEIALRRDREPERYREVLRDGLADIERLQALLGGMLSLTRRSLVRTQTQPVAILPVVRRLRAYYPELACVGFDPLARPVEAEGGAAPDPARDPASWRVMAHPELLQAALSNVVQNALRYAPGDPPTLSVDVADGGIRLVVADHGRGIPADEREHVFEPFARLATDPSVRISDGYGLGLPVARFTMRAFGGDLTCEARPDGQPGAAFVFSLPLLPPRAASAPRAEAGGDVPSAPAKWEETGGLPPEVLDVPIPSLSAPPHPASGER